MTKTYELVVLLSPEMNDHQLNQTQQSIVELVTKHSGKVVATDVWGKRVLAYTLNKFNEAFYVFYTIDMDTEQVQAFERAVRLSDLTMRYLLVVQDKDMMAKKNAEIKSADSE